MTRRLLQENGDPILLENGGYILLEYLRLTIAGVDFLPYYKTNSAKIREIIQNKSNVMTFEVVVRPGSGQPMPVEGSEVSFMLEDRHLFGGYITKIDPEEVGLGQMFIYKIEASDYSFIFNNKIARRGYTNTSMKDIIEDLMETYVDASYGFTTTNVDTGPMISTISFDHVSVRKAFEKIQKLTGYVWYTDYEKNLYFKPTDATPAPEEITDSSANYENISLSYDTSQVRNSVIVIGSANGEESLSTVSESFAGDGETRSWELEAKPSQVLSIKLNGVDQQFSLDLNERDTDVFIYSFGDATFGVTDATTTPTGGDTILITYYPRIPIIVQESDQDSIDFFSAKDGGDGVMEYTVKDTSINSKAEAKERAIRELEEFAMPLLEGTFRTRTTQLLAGSYFVPGQYVVMNLPSWGISSDVAFLVQEVVTYLNEDGQTIEFVYDVRFGGKLAGVREFLESLASDGGGEESEPEEILTIEHINEIMTIEDEAPIHALFSPPFEYGPAGNPQGVWNLSEWA